MFDKSTIDEVFTYQESDDTQIDSMVKIRERAKELAYTIFDECPASADRSDALRKLREVVMTANASIVLRGIV